MPEELGGEPIGQPVGHPVWLPVGEAARRLGVTREAVRRRIKRGTLETRREVDGNRVRTLCSERAVLSAIGSA
jgi:excisionase family DNA binding protein